MRHIAELQRVNGAAAVQHRQSSPAASSSVCTSKPELSCFWTSPGWWRSLLTRPWRRRRSAKRCQPLWRWANGASERRLSPVSVCSLAAGLHRPQAVSCWTRGSYYYLCVLSGIVHVCFIERAAVFSLKCIESHTVPGAARRGTAHLLHRCSAEARHSEESLRRFNQSKRLMLVPSKCNRIFPLVETVLQ